MPCQRQLRGAAGGWAHRERGRGIARKLGTEIQRTKASTQVAWELHNCTASLCLKGAVRVLVQKPGVVAGSLLKEVEPGLAALENLSPYIFLSSGIRSKNFHVVPADLYLVTQSSSGLAPLKQNH